jgi:hypothetical protein
LPHTVLSRTRLPIPPREQKNGSYNARVAACLQAEIEAFPGITQPASFLRARTSN